MSRLAVIMYYSPEDGEVTKVVEGGSLKREDSLLRADVLKDCLLEIGEKYDEAVGQFQRDLQEMSDARRAQPTNPRP